MFFSLKKMLRDPFFRKSGMFFGASMLVAFLNYLFHPVMAKYLSVEDFGEVQALFSLLTQMTAFLSALTLVAVHAAVNGETDGERGAIMNLLHRCTWIVLGIGAIGLAFFSTPLAYVLRFHDPSEFVVLAILFVTTAYYSIHLGDLQGRGRFGAVSLGGLLVAAGRLVFALLFVIFGWRVFGALFGIVVSQVLALGYVYAETRRHRVATSSARRLTATRIRHEIAYIALVALTTAYTTILYTVDVLIVKHYFSPEIAGAYGGIAIMAKMICFAALPLVSVFVSSMRLRDDRRTHARAFAKAMTLIVVMSVCLVAIFSVTPTRLITLMIGSRYASFASLLPTLAIAFACVNIANVCFTYLLAMRWYRVLIFVIVGSIVLVAITLLRHASLEEIVQNMLIVAAVTALCGLASVVPTLVMDRMG